MTLNVIQINDISLVASTASDNNIVSSAGAAILHEDGLKIGNEAEQMAKIFPRRLNDSYWQKPSAEPLKDVPDYARHHADLIYYQLKSLHEEMGKPAELVLAVPSNMDAEQLSIVLGVAHPLPFEFVGLTDLAVAGTAYTGHSGDVLHYDLQRYQTVITLLECDEFVERKEHIIIPNLGLQSIKDKWAAIITNAFVEQSRFDPMHAAQSEQTLYNKLSEWIASLAGQNDLNIELGNKERNYNAKLDRNAFIEANDSFMRSLIRRGKELSPSAQLHLGNYHIETLQALSNHSNAMSILPAHAALTGISENHAEIITRDADLPLVTRLRNATTTQTNQDFFAPPAPTPERAIAPTHLLVDNTATALPGTGADVNLHIVDNHLVTSANPVDALAKIVHINEQLHLIVDDPGIRLNNKSPVDSVGLESGDIITAQGGLSARLIIVTS